ncbi:Alpha carbonic anhydrase [Macleaya cordata]|uniref:Carbonic anhydrase n=1 Tax=Macleaya cordata TaxID=56857 RepID=A0A200R5I4_MACCD|nr:Alpha carbonic anhydrase [Macleaya cordata]
MMKNFMGKPILVSTFLLVVLILNSRPITSQEVEDQREFDYLRGSGKGPENWGDLHEEWAACKNGTLQSPIDLLHERVEVVPELGKIKKSYKPANATIKNRGHDITLHWGIGSAGSIQINGTEYALDQCHWHSPSEHTINGKRFALELHMIHRNLELNKTAVIGVLFNIGGHDSFLSELKKDIWNIADTDGAEVNIGVVDPRHIKIGGRKYYRYLGSLTTPPCTEGVIWTINKRLRTVSKEQVMLLRRAVHDDSENNARPVQPLNDRDILFYGPKHRHYQHY